MKIMRIPSLRHAARRGNSAVELALLMPLLFVIFAGIAEYGLAVYDQSTLDGSARTALAYALKNPNDTAGITTVAQSTGGAVTTNATVTTNPYCQCSDGSSVSCAGSCSSGTVRQYMQVSVSVNYTSPLNSVAIISPPNTLSSQATMRIK